MHLVLFGHIGFGSLAVLALPVAMFSAKGRAWHCRAGRLFAVGLGGALVCALILVFLIAPGRGLFLGLIALFTAYQWATGLRMVRTRHPELCVMDRLLAGAMGGVAAVMAGYGALLFAAGVSSGIALCVLALPGAAMAIMDLARRAWPQGAARIALHLQRIGGAAIATVTAVAVINLPVNPASGWAWLPWLLPTALGTPMIVVASARRLRRSAYRGAAPRA